MLSCQLGRLRDFGKTSCRFWFYCILPNYYYYFFNVSLSRIRFTCVFPKIFVVFEMIHFIDSPFSSTCLCSIQSFPQVCCCYLFHTKGNCAIMNEYSLHGSPVTEAVLEKKVRNLIISLSCISLFIYLFIFANTELFSKARMCSVYEDLFQHLSQANHSAIPNMVYFTLVLLTSAY